MYNEKSGNFKIKRLEKGSRLSMLSTIGMIGMMLLYLLMTVSSSVKLAQQTDIISNHPFEVVISAGDVKLCISEMQMQTERLHLNRSNHDIEIVKSALNELYTRLEEPLLRMGELYLGDADDVNAISRTLSVLLDAQTDFLEYISLSQNTDEDIGQYEKEHLEPVYTQALNDIEKVITIAKEKKLGYGNTAASLQRFTLISSIIMMVLMTAVLLISQYILWKQRKELAFRSQLFDSLSMSIDDTFIIQDAKTGRVYYHALNMERVLGIHINRVEDIYEHLKPEDSTKLAAAIENPPFPSPIEEIFEYVKPDRKECWLFIRIYQTGSLSNPQLIIVISDRTDDVLSRQALQDAMESANRANSAKGDFLSRMSHEIRTPLNAIMGMCTIASASIIDNPRAADCLSKISLSSNHLLMLINDILDMSKIENDKMLLQNEPFDIFQVINGFISTVYAQAIAKNITFEETIGAFGNQTVYIGDSLRLNQILLNLSSNAVKFTPSGGRITLEVTKVLSKSKVDIIRFVLSDTGIGMTQEAIDRIFLPFEQADTSISSRFGGTGLGMSITKNLVAMMNGKIQVKSKPQAGTTCIVELPLLRGVEDVSEPDFQGQSLRALIVDDEEDICLQTACLMDKLKIEPVWETSGIKAAECAKKASQEGEPFDIYVIDWKMPFMDGIELTRKIRGTAGDEPCVIMASNYDTAQIEPDAYKAGVNAFLPKPLYRSSLYACIRDILAQKNNRNLIPLKEENPLAGRHLLVVEDNPLNMEIACELLKMCGMKVECAANGREALELFLNSEPGWFDAILMDVQMPVMNGHEAARHIRLSSHPMAASIPIIATTANAFSNDISAALEAGMNAHVSKPLNIQQLCSVLWECIHKNEAGL